MQLENCMASTVTEHNTARHAGLPHRLARMLTSTEYYRNQTQGRYMGEDHSYTGGTWVKIIHTREVHG